MVESGKIAGAVTAVLATAAAQYFGVTAPNARQGEIDRDANWSCRDQLAQTTEDRDEWIARYLEE